MFIMRFNPLRCCVRPSVSSSRFLEQNTELLAEAVTAWFTACFIGSQSMMQKVYHDDKCR